MKRPNDKQKKTRPKPNAEHDAGAIPNSAWTVIRDLLAEQSGNVLVLSNLMGATLQEKAIIASLIPVALKLIRKADPARLQMFMEGAELGVMCEPPEVDPPKEDATR